MLDTVIPVSEHLPVSIDHCIMHLAKTGTGRDKNKLMRSESKAKKASRNCAV